LKERLEKPNFHNRRSTTCGKKTTLIPARKAEHLFIKLKFCLSGKFLDFAVVPQATLRSPAVMKIWLFKPPAL
jgi:hypothetical protein